MFEEVRDVFEHDAYNVEFRENLACTYRIDILDDRVSLGHNQNGEDTVEVPVRLKIHAFQYECDGKDGSHGGELLHYADPRPVRSDSFTIDSVLLADPGGKVDDHEYSENSDLLLWNIKVVENGDRSRVSGEFRSSYSCCRTYYWHIFFG